MARLLQLLREKKAEVAAVSKKVTRLEAVVAELEGRNSELFGEKGELAKKLVRAKEAVQMVSSEKVEVERSPLEFWKAAEACRLEMEVEVKAKLEEQEVLSAKEAEVDSRVQILESELAAAVSNTGNWRLRCWRRGESLIW